MTGEPEERREQGDRCHHHRGDDQRDGDAAVGHERDAGDGETEDGDDDGAPGEHDGLPRGGHRTPSRLLDGHPTVEELSVAGDEEQRVVDADTESHHDADLGRPTGDVDDVHEQRHRAHAQGQPEDGHADGQAHRDDGSERQEEDHHGGDETDHLADVRLRLLEREEQVTAHLDLERAVHAGIDHRGFEPLEVVDAEGLTHGVLHPYQRHAPIGRHRPRRDSGVVALVQRARRIGRGQHLGETADRRPQLGQLGLRRR